MQNKMRNGHQYILKKLELFKLMLQINSKLF